MTAYDSAQLDRVLRKRVSYDMRHQNSPPQLRLPTLAAKYGVTMGEIRRRIDVIKGKP